MLFLLLFAIFLLLSDLTELLPTTFTIVYYIILLVFPLFYYHLIFLILLLIFKITFTVFYFTTFNFITMMDHDLEH